VAVTNMANSPATNAETTQPAVRQRLMGNRVHRSEGSDLWSPRHACKPRSMHAVKRAWHGVRPARPILWGMTFQPTTLERAFELARTGKCSGIVEIRTQLRAEGYGLGQLEGPILMRQLQEICVASRKSDDASAPPT
jgi:hypothetical protein